MAIDISKVADIDGFIGGCLVDSETAMILAMVSGGTMDMEVAGAANTEVVKAKNNAMKTLGLNDALEDILITLGKQYHLIRPLGKKPSIFLYLALDKKNANLGLARIKLKEVEESITI